MASVWSYEGRRVIVSGGGGAGMGAAAVTELAELGAEIHVIDLKEPPVKVAGYHAVDLRDPDAIAAAVDAIGGNMDLAVDDYIAHNINYLRDVLGIKLPPYST